MVERREAILRERIEFEAATADPSRLLSKKVQGDPGRLLREEKFRKTITKELPLLEQKLKQAISEWESSNNEEFYYCTESMNSTRYLELMELQDEEERRKKQEDKLRRVSSLFTTD